MPVSTAQSSGRPALVTLLRGFLVLLLTAVGLGLPAQAVRSQTVPPGFFIEDAFPTASFYLPTLLVFMPDGRKLVVEKEGQVWVVTSEGTKLTTPFIDLSTEVLSNDDRGLHGVALDPGLTANRWVYLLYTVDPDSNAVDHNIGAFARLERSQASNGATGASGGARPCAVREHDALPRGVRQLFAVALATSRARGAMGSGGGARGSGFADHAGFRAGCGVRFGAYEEPDFHRRAGGGEG